MSHTCSATSSRETSSRAAFNPSSPSPAISTRKPASRSALARNAAVFFSSSIIRIRIKQFITQKGRFRGSGLFLKTKSMPDLRQGGARLSLNERNIGTVDNSVNGSVFAEVTGRDRLSGLRLGLRDVARIHAAVRGRVSNQNIQPRGHARQSRAGSALHIAQCHNEMLGVGN